MQQSLSPTYLYVYCRPPLHSIHLKLSFLYHTLPPFSLVFSSSLYPLPPMEEEAREMESPVEAMASTTSNGELPPPPTIVKGKRTKRQRVMPATDTTTSSAESKNLGGEYATEEEEEMANCLILLAQGSALEHSAGEKFTSRRFTEAATTTAGRAGFYVYECKTCNKCFPSFQALGGHRASHKRPKITAIPTDAQTEQGRAVIDEDNLKISMNSFMKPLAAATGSNSKTRVHECSICGSEFFSGQALGGHMRRHRPVVAPEGKKERNFLSLDLNLPAPAEEDLRGSPSVGLTLSLAGKRPVVFSPGTTLVDCHY